VTPEVEAEVRLHDLTADWLHTDLDHMLCACRNLSRWPEPVVVVSARPPLGAGLQDGGVCFACGGMTVRTGTCTTCTSCGETGGCG
jgi:hypothetical protein